MAYYSKNKYGNHKVTFQGMKYDSKKEAQRHYELKLLQRAGEITELKTQIPFVLLDSVNIIKNGKKSKQSAVKYIADFVYINDLGIEVVEDVKGYKTSEYKKKKKIVEHLFKIKITEI